MYTPPLNLRGVGDVVAESRLLSKEEFPYSGLWIFSGAQGSGKTLLAMHCVKHILETCPKVKLVSNINIFGTDAIPYQGLKSFHQHYNGQYGTIFLIDEIHTLYNSLMSANMSVSQITEWSQNRKNRRLILGTTQRYSRAAKGLREQCSWHYECNRALFHRFYSFHIKDGADYDDQGIYIGEPTKRFWYVPNVSVMRMYNTREVVKPIKENEVV